MPNPLEIVKTLGKLKAVTSLRNETTFLQDFRRTMNEVDLGLANTDKGFNDVYELGIQRTRTRVRRFEDIATGKSNESSVEVTSNDQGLKKLGETVSDKLQAQSWLKQSPKLGDAEAAAAIRKYTSGPAKELNKYFADKALGVSEKLTTAEENTILGWDRALRKLSKPIVEEVGPKLWRGVPLKGLQEIVAQTLDGSPMALQTGKEFTFAGHSSFSFSNATADSFLKEGGVMFVIDKTKGVKGVDITKSSLELLGQPSNLKGFKAERALKKAGGSRAHIDALNDFPEEAEFMVTREQQYRIVAIEKNGIVSTVHLEPISK